MTVKELKAELAKYPDDMVVLTYVDISEDYGDALYVDKASKFFSPYYQSDSPWKVNHSTPDEVLFIHDSDTKYWDRA